MPEGAEVIVTANIADFPAIATEPYRVRANTPDQFLTDLFSLDPAAMTDLLAGQAAGYGPPMAIPELLDALDGIAPSFVAHARPTFR
jgi:hypothetical protein